MSLRVIAVALLLCAAPAYAQAPAAIDKVPPPGYPAGFPYLPTHHGLAGTLLGWPSQELCEVITLTYPGETVPTLRVKMRAAMRKAGWRIRRDHREPVDVNNHGWLLEGRRTGYMVLAIFAPRRKHTQLHIYDCGPT